MDTYRSCIVQGHPIAYSRAGTGKTVLLVHGITTWSFIFRKIYEELSRGYDVIAVDLMGCGHSAKPLNISYSIKNHAGLLAEFVDALGLEKFHYVGHDLGGGIGQIFAVNYPHRLFSLTLINSVAFDFWPVQPIISMRTPILRQFAMASLDMGVFKLIVRRGFYHKELVTDELMEHFWMPMRTKEGRKAFLHFAHCLDNTNLLEISSRLHSLPLPVMIVRGDADVYLSASIAEKLHETLPDSRLERIATAGHFLMEDEPRWLLEKLTGFFKSIVND
jgi:pimeloyl-ACP methyl ester carboxylesterase